MRYVRLIALFLAGLAVGVVAVLAVAALQPRECLLVSTAASADPDFLRFNQHLREGWIITSRPATGIQGLYCMERPLLPSAH